jgi:hypothetical protein
MMIHDLTSSTTFQLTVFVRSAFCGESCSRGRGTIEVGERYSQATDSALIPTAIDEAKWIPIPRIRGSRKLATAGRGEVALNIVGNNLAEPLMGVAFLFLFFRTFARHGTRRWR